MPRFLVYPLLFEDVLVNNAVSMRQLVDVSAADVVLTPTPPGLAYGKKYRAVWIWTLTSRSMTMSLREIRGLRNNVGSSNNGSDASK